MIPHLLALAEGGGFDPLSLTGGGNTLWTWVIFLIALPLMWKFVMAPITQALLERDKAAAKAIETAEKASAEAERARAEVEVRLGEAEAEASKLLAAARERAEGREREIVDAAKQEATALLENARRNIQAEQDKAIAAIRNEVVDLTVHAAGELMGRRVDSEDDRRLVGELVSAGEDSKA